MHGLDASRVAAAEAINSSERQIVDESDTCIHETPGTRSHDGGHTHASASIRPIRKRKSRSGDNRGVPLGLHARCSRHRSEQSRRCSYLAPCDSDLVRITAANRPRLRDGLSRVARRSARALSKTCAARATARAVYLTRAAQLALAIRALISSAENARNVVVRKWPWEVSFSIAAASVSSFGASMMLT